MRANADHFQIHSADTITTFFAIAARSRVPLFAYGLTHGIVFRSSFFGRLDVGYIDWQTCAVVVVVPVFQRLLEFHLHWLRHSR